MKSYYICYLKFYSDDFTTFKRFEDFESMFNYLKSKREAIDFYNSSFSLCLTLFPEDIVADLDGIDLIVPNNLFADFSDF